MAHRIELSNAAAKRFRRLSGDLRARVERKIREIAEDPLLKGSEEIHTGMRVRRARVGGWRIVYSWLPEFVRIEEIAPRGQVYKDFLSRYR